MDYDQIRQNHQTQTFAMASMFCGTISLIMCCTGILSVPAGAMGILFAILSKRKDRGFHPASQTGIRLSCLGIVLGITFLAYSIYLIVTQPEYRQMYLDILQQYSQYYDTYSY